MKQIFFYIICVESQPGGPARRPPLNAKRISGPWQNHAISKVHATDVVKKKKKQATEEIFLFPPPLFFFSFYAPLLPRKKSNCNAEQKRSACRPGAAQGILPGTSSFPGEPSQSMLGPRTLQDRLATQSIRGGTARGMPGRGGRPRDRAKGCSVPASLRKGTACAGGAQRAAPGGAGAAASPAKAGEAPSAAQSANYMGAQRRGPARLGDLLLSAGRERRWRRRRGWAVGGRGQRQGTGIPTPTFSPYFLEDKPRTWNLENAQWVWVGK